MNFSQAVAVRFLKGFVSGGLASVTVLLATGFSIKSLSDIKHFGVLVLGAFVSGGLLGLQKAWSWQPVQ